MEYATTVWDPFHKDQIDKIKKVQRRAVRYVTGRHINRSSVNTMLKDLKWKSLQTRRKEARLIMMYRIINNMVAINSENHFTKPTRRSRHVQNHSYAIPSATKDFRKWSFSVNTVKDWNNLPPDIAASKSLASFKVQVAKLWICTVHVFIQFLTLRTEYSVCWMWAVYDRRRRRA